MLDEENIAMGKLKSNNEDYNLPELFSMQLNKKIYNNRLSNHYDNLGGLVTGVTKDIKEVADMLLGMEKYGVQLHSIKNQVNEVAAVNSRGIIPPSGVKIGGDKKAQQI